MSKWVETTKGTYKLVDDNDVRPEVRLPNRQGAPHIMYTPSWATYEPLMHSGNPQTEISATEAFIAERDRETRHSEKARKWEEGRKKSWAREKPNWVKKERKLTKDA